MTAFPRPVLLLFAAMASLLHLTACAAQPRTIPKLGMTFMPIPAGTFLMGSPATEVGRFPNEGPQTKVTISRPFWLGRTEVTQAQWHAVMATTVAEQIQRMLADPTRYAMGEKQPETLRHYYARATDGSSSLRFNKSDDAPMYFVGWDEAAEFCHRLTDRERAAGRLPAGYEYRLPTEAEWEYACRAGTTTATYAGDLVIKGAYNVPVLDTIAWYGGNSSVGYRGPGRDTSAWPEKQYPGGIAAQRTVAMKKPNAWGLYDMIGNVWEWCSDWYHPLPGGFVTDPTGPKSGKYRIWRGGGYGYGTMGVYRAAARTASPPTMRVSDLGFRVALGPVR